MAARRARMLREAVRAPAVTAALWSVLAATAPAEPEVPELTGRTVDLAGILSISTEETLDALLGRLEDATGAQVAVLTVSSLGGEPIETYSLRVAEQWALGSGERDDGALLLVAVEERRMRIEVGYGLEGQLPDAAVSRIIRDVLAPRFGHGDYDGGVLAGVRSLAGHLAPAEVWAASEAPSGPTGKTLELSEAPPPGIDMELVLAFALLLVLMPMIGGVYGVVAKTDEARAITFAGLLLPIMLGGSLIADELIEFPPESGKFLLGGVAAVGLFSGLFWGLRLYLRKRPAVLERWRSRLDELADGRLLLRTAGRLGMPDFANGGEPNRWLRRAMAALPLLILVGLIAWIWHPGYAAFFFHNLVWLFLIYRGTLHASLSTAGGGGWSSTRRRSARGFSWSSTRSSGGGSSFRGGGGSFGGGGASGSW